MKTHTDDLKKWYFDLFFEQFPQFAEFGDWICATEELETIFEPADYLSLLETNFAGSFDVHAIRKLLKTYLPGIEVECETLLLQRKLESALQASFLWMVEEIGDLIGFQGYPLTELGITDYGDADVRNRVKITTSFLFWINGIIP